jgi:hypothetical protein
MEENAFLRRQNYEVRGWAVKVMKCVESIGEPEFANMSRSDRQRPQGMIPITASSAALAAEGKPKPF